MTGWKPVLLRIFFASCSQWFVLSADFTDYHRFFISFLLCEGFLYEEGNDRLEASAPRIYYEISVPSSLWFN